VPYFRVWVATKYRKRLLEGDVVTKVKEVVLQVATEKSIGLVECETMADHVHMRLIADTDTHLSSHMKLLKGRSAYEVFKAYPEVKLDAGISSLWQEGFKSRLVPASQLETVRRYIRTQDERLEGYVP
jgi:putative transposase